MWTYDAAPCLSFLACHFHRRSQSASAESHPRLTRRGKPTSSSDPHVSASLASVLDAEPTRISLRWLCQQPTRHPIASSTRSCPFPPIWTLPKKPNPNPSMNGASSSGRINRTTLDHLGRPRTKTDGGIILYTRQEVARHHPLLPLTPPDRFRGLHRHPLPDSINVSSHDVPMVLKIELLGT